MKGIWQENSNIIAAGVIVLVFVVVGTHMYWSFAHSTHLLTIMNRANSDLDHLVVRIGGERTSRLGIPANTEIDIELKTLKGIRYEFFRVTGEEEGEKEIRLGSCTPSPQRKDLLMTEIRFESVSPPRFSCEITGVH